MGELTYHPQYTCAAKPHGVKPTCGRLPQQRHVGYVLVHGTQRQAKDLLQLATKAYAKTDLLILDEWLMRPLTLQQSYDLFEIIEARTKHGFTIFCTQYDTDGWYERINTDPTVGGG